MVIFYNDLLEFKSDVDKLKYIFHPREGNRRWFASIPLSPSPSFRSLRASGHSCPGAMNHFPATAVGFVSSSERSNVR